MLFLCGTRNFVIFTIFVSFVIKLDGLGNVVWTLERLIILSVGYRLPLPAVVSMFMFLLSGQP